MTISLGWNNDGEDFGFFGYPQTCPADALSVPISAIKPVEKTKLAKPLAAPVREYKAKRFVVPKRERIPWVPVEFKLPERRKVLGERPLGTSHATVPSSAEALAYITPDYLPGDVSIDVDSSPQALKTHLKTRIEYDFRQGEEQLANLSIYGFDDRVYSLYRKLCIDREDEYVKGIVLAEKDRLDGMVQREKIKASIVADYVPAASSVISSVLPAQASAEIANAEFDTENSIVNARLATAYDIAVKDAALRLAIANAGAGTRISIAEANADTALSIASADANTRLNIAEGNAATRLSIAQADRTTRESIADAGRQSQENIADTMADATIKASLNSYYGYAFSAASSWAHGLASILAAGASQMGKPGIAWVE